MSRLLLALLLVCVCRGAAAQAGPALTPFGTDAALAAFGQDLTARQARIDGARARVRSQEDSVQAAKGRLRCGPAVTVTVFPGAIVPTAARAAVVAGQTVDLWTGAAMPGVHVAMLDSLSYRAHATARDSAGADGRFALSIPADAAARTLALDATALDYRVTMAPIILSPGDSVAVHLPLCPGPGPDAPYTFAGVIHPVQQFDPSDDMMPVQTPGVALADVVARRGDMLVTLHRGRLFTVDVSGPAPRPVASVDAFGYQFGDWWRDEMLVVGETVIAIGYDTSSFENVAQIHLFHLDAAGGLTRRSTYRLRYDVYRAGPDYRARVVGERLVFYAPLELRNAAWAEGVEAVLPAMSRQAGDEDALFIPIATAAHVYRAAHAVGVPSAAVLHTVVSCAVGDGTLDCTATAIADLFSETVYLSAEAAYAWVLDPPGALDGADAVPSQAALDAAPSTLYRLPFDGSAPRAIRVAGRVSGAFSFLEADGGLNVRVAGRGRQPWMPDATADSVGLALLRVPLSQFGDGTAEAPAAAYRPLPRTQAGTFVGRFVGRHLVYGSAPLLLDPQAPLGHTAFAVDWRTGAVDSVALGHAVGRIEAMGDDVVVLGRAADGLHLTGIRLGTAPRVGGTYVLADTLQDDGHPIGVFYYPQGDARGVLGLTLPVDDARGYASLWDGAAAVRVLETRDGSLRPLGDLAGASVHTDDGCVASCDTWVGNARPLYLGDRVFALMGYELVEGAVSGGRLREVRRVSFAPAAR